MIDIVGLYAADVTYWVVAPAGTVHRPGSCVDPLTPGFYLDRPPEPEIRSALELVEENEGWPEFFCPACCEAERAEFWWGHFGEEYDPDEWRD